MSGITPSHDPENNTTWLNDLMSDIIDPGHWTSHGASRCDMKNSVIDHCDLYNDPQPARSQFSPSQRQHSTHDSFYKGSSASRRSARSPVFNGCSHYSYRSTARKISAVSPAESSSYGSPPSYNTSPELGSEERRPLSLDPFHKQSRRDDSDPEKKSHKSFRESSSPPISLRTYLRNSEALTGREMTALPYVLPKRRFSSHTTIVPEFEITALPYVLPKRRSSLRNTVVPEFVAWSPTPIPLNQSSVLSHDTRRDVMKKTAPHRPAVVLRTSLGRIDSEKEVSDLQQPHRACIQSGDVESVAEFTSHPAVRPFNDDKACEKAADSGNDDECMYPGRVRLTLIVLGICVSVFMISLERSIITTAIPQITRACQSFNDIGWYGSAYFLTASAFQPLYGRVYASFDTRWTFLTALVIFEIGSLLGAVAPRSEVLIAGRALQGFGSAGILTGSFAIGTQSMPGERRSFALALISMVYTFGSVAGPVLGGVFTDLVTWRWIFWVNLPIGAVAFAIMLLSFKPRKNEEADRSNLIKRIFQLDLLGTAMLLSAFTMLFLGLQFSEIEANWNNSLVIGLFCGSGVNFVIFISWMIFQGDAALIPLRIIRQRTIAASCGVAFFLHGGFLIHAYYLPIWFQAIKGTSAIESGVSMIAYMLTGALFSLLGSTLISRFGLYAVPTIIGTAVGTIGCGFLTTISADTDTGTWIGYEILVSAGIGIAIQQSFNILQTTLPSEEILIGTAVVAASQSLGGAIFVSVGNAILQSYLLEHKLGEVAAEIDVRTILRLGATGFLDFVPKEFLPEFIELYSRSLQRVFMVAVPLVGLAFVCSLFMAWKSTKLKHESLSEKWQTEGPSI